MSCRRSADRMEIFLNVLAARLEIGEQRRAIARALEVVER